MREPSMEVVVGAKGVGKTHATKEIIKLYITSDHKTGWKARPVLVFDVNNEYEGYKAIDFNINEPNIYKRAENIRNIKVPKAYRILPYKKDKSVMSPEEYLLTVQTITTYFNNGMLVLEDINQYIDEHLKKAFVGFIVGLRHQGADLIVHYHTIGAPPPKIWGNMTYLRLHRQTDPVSRVPRKLPNIDLIYLANSIVTRRYHEGDIYYYCWIDIYRDKLKAVSEEDLDRACREYLQINPTIINNMMRLKDESNNQRFTTENDAINSWIEDRKRFLE